MLLQDHYDKRFNFIKMKENVILFFIRHGKGIHNMNMTKRKIIGALDIVKKTAIKDYDKTHKLTDASLDETGITQAEKAGDSLLIYLDTNMKDWRKYKLLFGSSRLFRTRQTIGTVMSRLFKSDNEIKYVINVIPCSHEVAVVEEFGKCVDTGFKNELAYENKQLCEKKSDDNEKCQDLTISSNGKQIKIVVNWSYYENHKYDCINDTVINVACDIATTEAEKK